MKNKKDTEYEIPKHALESFARRVMPEIQRFFDSEEGKKEFEAWKMKQATLKETDENNINDERN